MEFQSSKIDTAPRTSRELKLRTRAHGLPEPACFELVETRLPPAQPNEALVRNRYFRVSASVRMMISEGAEAVAGVPFPPLNPGDTLAELALGEVIVPPLDGSLDAGAFVLHHSGFRELALVRAESCRRLEPVLPEPIAHLSHGWTAYAALQRAARVRAGDTVLVTSAAGAIGSMAPQIARKLGAKCVVGSTSTPEKAARARAELGYDAVIARGAGPLLPQLQRAAPEGLDVVLDSVGGGELSAAVRAARHGARIVVLGALSGQLAAEGTGRTAPVQLDSFPILLNKLTLQGYSADDDPDAEPEFERLFAAGLQNGDMSFPHTLIRGMDRATEALCASMRGQYIGAVIVEV